MSIKLDIIIKCFDALLKNKKVEYWDNKTNNYKQTTDPERIKECVEFKIPLRIKYTKKVYKTSEFIKEAKKHDCFGYLRHKLNDNIVLITRIVDDEVTMSSGVSFYVKNLIDYFLFLDGQPIVINNMEEFKDYD